jgi:hypothetical protein
MKQPKNANGKTGRLSALAEAPCSANWHYSTNCNVNIWTWEARRGLKYRVTQAGNNIQAHITTGEAHKFTSTIGHYATVNEARQRCVDDWQNDARTEPPAN